jgi:ABC-type phosphate transport system substrate-binding protein
MTYFIFKTNLPNIDKLIKIRLLPIPAPGKVVFTFKQSGRKVSLSVCRGEGVAKGGRASGGAADLGDCSRPASAKASGHSAEEVTQEMIVKEMIEVIAEDEIGKQITWCIQDRVLERARLSTAVAGHEPARMWPETSMQYPQRRRSAPIGLTTRTSASGTRAGRRWTALGAGRCVIFCIILH